MDVQFVEKSKENLKLFVTGEETIFNPIKTELLEDPSVTFAGFKKRHPQLDGMDFVIKSSNAELSLKKAIKSFKAKLNELSKLF